MTNDLKEKIRENIEIKTKKERVEKSNENLDKLIKQLMDLQKLPIYTSPDIPEEYKQKLNDIEQDLSKFFTNPDTQTNDPERIEQLVTQLEDKRRELEENIKNNKDKFEAFLSKEKENIAIVTYINSVLDEEDFKKLPLNEKIENLHKMIKNNTKEPYVKVDLKIVDDLSFENLKAQNNKLHEQLKALTDELGNVQKKKNIEYEKNLKRQLENKQEVKNKHVKEIEEFQNKHQKEIEELQNKNLKEIEAFQYNHEQEIQKLQQNITNLENTINESRIENQELIAKNKEWIVVCIGLAAQNKKFIDENKNVNTKLYKLESAHKELNNEMEKKTKEITEVSNNLKSLKETNEKLKKMVEKSNIFKGVSVEQAVNKTINPTEHMKKLSQLLNFFYTNFGNEEINHDENINHENITVGELTSKLIDFTSKFKNITKGSIVNNTYKTDTTYSTNILTLIYSTSEEASDEQQQFLSDNILVFDVALAESLTYFEYNFTGYKNDNAFLALYVKKNVYKYNITYKTGTKYLYTLSGLDDVYKTNMDYYTQKLIYVADKWNEKNEIKQSGGNTSDGSGALVNGSPIYLMKTIRYMYYLHGKNRNSTQIEDYCINLMIITLLYSMRFYKLFEIATIDLIFTTVTFQAVKDPKVMLIPYFVPFLFV